jgi:hypothetical protein
MLEMAVLSIQDTKPGTSTVGISITTENAYTDQANVPTAGAA